MGWDGNRGYFEQRTESSEEPLRHFLSAQRKDEFLRASTDNCAVSFACKENNVEVSSEDIGAPFGKHIFQIVYAQKTRSDEGDPIPLEHGPQSYWKSIVAETSPGMYREIFLLKGEGAFWTWPPSTADVVTAGATKLLFTTDSTTHGRLLDPWEIRSDTGRLLGC